MYKTIKLILIGISLLASSGYTHAGLIYTYVGNTFTAANAPLTLSDFLTATIVLDDELGASLNNVDISGFDGFKLFMSVGGNVYDNSPVIRDLPRLNTNTTIAAFITTDSNSNILEWYLELTLSERGPVSPLVNYNLISSYKSIYNYTEDYYFDDSEGYNENMQGVWSTRVTTVSAPSSLAIFALGLMGLVSRRFKKQA
jgi:hypothetical protein